MRYVNQHNHHDVPIARFNIGRHGVIRPPHKKAPVHVACALFLSFLVACSQSSPTAIPLPTVTADTATSLPTLEPTTALDATQAPISDASSVTSLFGGRIDELNAAWVGEEVTLTGQVVNTASFSKGFEFTLEDGTGQIIVLTWLDKYDNIRGREGLQRGASIQVTGVINRFENELQIVPSTSRDIVVLVAGNSQALEKETGSLSSRDVGSWISVEGHVTSIKPFSGGLRVYLDDGSGEVLLLLWQSVLERVPENMGVPSVGSRLRARGYVAEYRDTLEIVPALPYDLEMLEAASGQPAQSNAIVPIGELDTGNPGEMVTVAGQVVVTSSFAKGFKFTLEDDTGHITLLMWQNVYDEHPNAAQLNVGAAAHATGWITEFEGELQIEPPSARDVELMTPAAPLLPERNIDSIGDYLGQRVTITGKVVRLERTGSGAKVYVSDDTGEALVYIWTNILV